MTRPAADPTLREALPPAGAERQPVSFWAGLPTRTRLILTVLAIDCVAAFVSCGLIVLIARNAVQVEMAASLATVEPLVADTIRSLRSPSPESVLHSLDLRFQSLRHVRVTILDAEGQRVGFGPSDRGRQDRDAPGWFVSLIAPEPHQHDLPIAVRGERIGTAAITTEPLDEIEEVWDYARTLALASLILNLAVLAALILALGRILRPLGRLAEGLTRLERHDYTAHLDPPASRELAVIAARFNRVAGALAEARAANGRLNRQLLTAQDDERARIALELHDEFGPCLFALEANAASVTRLAAGAGEIDRVRLATRAGDIGSIVAQVQSLNRDLLNRLRPHALGEVPLTDCLNLLLRDFGRRHPDTTFEGDFEGLARGYGDIVDLTVFRCIQESSTNAVRHGGASHVRARATEETDAAGMIALQVSVEDDGSGIAPGHRVGLGLSGMRERVEALGGQFSLGRASLDNGSDGTVVRITIPIDPERGEGEDPPASAAPQPK
ncbi:ATP-binding protein [Methylorubrum zatmanii]|uniref:Oxygen sensor histidine kinase NreB n=1 Tax=Methylorubrum zatmanii TaxID=29429 RepID=A0ABW1WWC6_9HYPH|nr:ATP-binding protein [Methylorubrum zatmanii]MBD8909579.1 ATPase [Methylorubrum zatmanii]